MVWTLPVYRQPAAEDEDNGRPSYSFICNVNNNETIDNFDNINNNDNNNNTDNRTRATTKATRTTRQQSPSLADHRQATTTVGPITLSLERASPLPTAIAMVPSSAQDRAQDAQDDGGQRAAAPEAHHRGRHALVDYPYPAP